MFSSTTRKFVESLTRKHREFGSCLQLQNGARIAVIGGGPAGSLFSYFFMQLANRLDINVELTIFEPRHFSRFGPAGCNHCGGIISESLVQLLAMDGINLPTEVVQRSIDSYVLHTDVGTVRIDTPIHEKRIASVYRGGGPKTLNHANWQSFDLFLLNLAQQQGAKLRREMITKLEWRNSRPWIAAPGNNSEDYDLVVFANGVNSHLLEAVENLGLGFLRPKTTSAFISEFHLGEELVRQYLGSAMHVFLLDLPRLKFAALIPKQDFITMCLLGHNIDSTLVQQFLDSPEVRACLPTAVNGNNLTACHCLPYLNIQGSPQPFTDRMLFIGDAGVTRLYKDGIGAAYRTAKAAASAALLDGVAAADFKRHFKPACNKIAADNAIGHFVFWVSGLIQGMRFSRRAMVRMTAMEQISSSTHRPMSTTLWDLFTGSAPYREILMRTLRPGFIISLAWNLILAATQSVYKRTDSPANK